MADLTRELADRLIESCTKFAYHELVAYSEGITIGELTDWLERGAVVEEKSRDKQSQELRRFTREYCRTDAVFSKTIFKELREGKEVIGKAAPYRDIKPIWAWFERRWPCENPLAIGTLLSSERVEALSLRDALDSPNAEIKSALDETGYFRADDLNQPSDALLLALKAAGFERTEESRAGQGPRPAPGGGA